LPARLRSTDSPSGTSEETVAEGRVRAIWEDILGIRNIALDEQFFEIGGDSLKAVRVAADASQVFSLDVSPALLFEAPTIRGFARLLDARQGDVAGPVVANSVIAASRGKLRRGSHAVA
jgi:acyl carrier protein